MIFIEVTVRKRGENMETKCPICGAPLADGKCGYCGYTARGMEQERENVNSDFEQTEKEQRQQGDVVGGAMPVSYTHLPCRIYRENSDASETEVKN